MLIWTAEAQRVSVEVMTVDPWQPAKFLVTLGEMPGAPRHRPTRPPPVALAHPVKLVLVAQEHPAELPLVAQAHPAKQLEFRMLMLRTAKVLLAPAVVQGLPARKL